MMIVHDIQPNSYIPGQWNPYGPGNLKTARSISGVVYESVPVYYLTEELVITEKEEELIYLYPAGNAEVYLDAEYFIPNDLLHSSHGEFFVVNDSFLLEPSRWHFGYKLTQLERCQIV